MKMRKLPIRPADPVAEALRSAGAERLLQRLRFNAPEGRIWLDDRRMLLLDASAFIAMRKELVELMGTELARGVLTRVGYLMGARDAELAWKLYGRQASVADVMAPGALLHSLQGFVQVKPVRRDLDIASGRCDCEFIWKQSVEHDAVEVGAAEHSDSVCWMAVGHSSGYFTGIAGRRILVREVECEATGGTQCRAVARPVEAWPDAHEDLQYFTLERIQPPRSRTIVCLPPAPISAGPSASASTIVGSSGALTAVLHKVQRVATTRATVLLLGESGVGKSLFAREIHERSKRGSAPFVAVNCAAIPESLIESELFGVEKGAYSGASQARPGRFEVAAGGTVFLDEIGTLGLQAQAKLLRVLQSGELERLGSTRTVQVDTRIIAATNIDLTEAVEQGTFREDLYYRINVFPITIPPLRERRDDLPALLESFIHRFSSTHERHCPGVTARALQAILNYDWPGNIREFENVVERAIILTDDAEPLDIQHLFSQGLPASGRRLLGLTPAGRLEPTGESKSVGPDPAVMAVNDRDTPPADAHEDARAGLQAWAQREVSGSGMSLPAALDLLRDSMIVAALQETGSNVARAAARLGVTRAQIDYRRRRT